MLGAACAASSSRAGAGAECFLATDCEDGLVCVPQPNGGRVCSSDLSRVTGKPPPGQDEDGAMAADAPAERGEGGPAGASDDAPVDTGVDMGTDAADAAPV